VSRPTSTPTARRATDRTKVPVQVWKIAAVITLGSFMSTLGSSLVNVGLKTLARDLHAPLVQAQWVTGGYLLAFAAVLPATAWLGRRFGAGRLWLVALSCFIAASALCVAAPNLPTLLAFRMVQGGTGALLLPAGQAVVGHVTGPERMGRVLNTMKIVSVLGPVVGPIVGGLLIGEASWRWLFLINIPVGVTALLCGTRIVPRGERTAASAFDAPGFLMVMTGLPLTVYALTAVGQTHSLTAGQTLVTLLAGLAALALFTRRSLTTAAPVLDLRLFTNRVYTAATVSVFFTGAALLGAMALFPLYFQLIRHESVIFTGLLMAAVGAGAAASMPFGGVLTDHIGAGPISVAGLAISAAATTPFTMLGAHVPLAIVEALQAAAGFGLGVAAMPALSVAYATVPRDRLPDATSEATIIQRLGGAVGTTTLVVVLERHTPPDIGTFQAACLWLTAATIAALGLAVWLAFEEHRRGRVLTARH
jgi:EmrB/QacA subfamily drug resistance transporter